MLASCDSKLSTENRPKTDDSHEDTTSNELNTSKIIGLWQTPDFSNLEFREGGTLRLFDDTLSVEGRYILISDNSLLFETSSSKDELYYKFIDDNTLMMGESKDDVGEFRRKMP